MYPSSETPLLRLLSDVRIGRWRRPTPNLLIGWAEGHGAFGGAEHERVHPLRFAVAWHIPHCVQWNRAQKAHCDYWHLDPFLPIETYQYWPIREQLAALLPSEPSLPARHQGQAFIGTVLKVELRQLAYHAWYRGGVEYCAQAEIYYLPEDRPELGQSGDRRITAELLPQALKLTQPLPLRFIQLERTHRSDSNVTCIGSSYRFSNEAAWNVWCKIVYDSSLCPRNHCHHQRSALYDRCFPQLESAPGESVAA